MAPSGSASHPFEAPHVRGRRVASAVENLHVELLELIGVGEHTVIYPVKDLAKSKELFGKLLGVVPYADTAYYVGFKVADQEIGLSPTPYGHSEGMTGPISYLHVDDIRASLQLILDVGGKQQQPVKDVGGGRLIASATDAEGNVIGLIQEP